VNATLTDAEQIGPLETLTVFFGGVTGPFVGSETLQGEIDEVFSGTSFIVESYDFPTLSEISPPSFAGHFKNYGGGTSAPSRNLTAGEAKNFFKSRLAQVPDLYAAKVLRIGKGKQKSERPLGITETNLKIAIVIIVLAFILWGISQLKAFIPKSA
jgi:hypothetical protein